MAIAIVERAKAAIQAFRNPSPYIPTQKNFPFPINVYVDRYGMTQWSLIDYETYAKQGYSQNAVVYSALRYKQDSVAQAPLRVYEGHPYNASLSEDLKSPLAQLALRPNEYMSIIEFMQYCSLYLNIHGNCFVALTGINDNLPLGMYPLRPDRVFIVPDDKKQQSIGYLYFPNGATPDTAIPIMPENMCHIKFAHPYDNLEGQGYGLSPMSSAAFVIDTDNRMTQFLDKFFKNNGMMPGGIVTLPYRANPEDIAKFRDQVVDMFGGANEWGKPLVIDESGNYQHIIPSFKDMVLDNIDNRNINRTTSVFGVDAMLIGMDRTSSTFSNRAEAENAFWTRVMKSELMLFEEEFRHKIRVGNNQFLKFDLSDIDAFREDVETKSVTYERFVNNFIPPNIAKKLVGLEFEDIEGGDIAYMPVGLVPVKQKEVELDKLENPDPVEPNPFDNNNPFDNQDTDNQGNMPDAPIPSEDRQTASNPIQYAIKAIVWDFEKREDFAIKQDSVAVNHEQAFAKAAKKQFEADKRAIMTLFTNHKKANLKAKKSFDYASFESAVKRYLAFEGLQAWRKTFTPLFVAVVQDARQEMGSQLNLASFMPIQEYKQEFVSRSSIEGEYWFSNYTLQFSTAINKTTSEDIHALIRDGLANGYGTDKIGNKIEDLFVQYMTGNTNSEDWQFMQDRFPKWRTEMIARTETHGAMSAGNHGFFELTGVPMKEWFATGDDRTRDTHLKAWNEYSEGGIIGAIGINENFQVGGYSCKHPGDRSLPLKEFIGCRCVELPYYPD